MKRGGAYYSTVATQLRNAHYNDLGKTHVVNIRNNGAVREWPADWVLETPSVVKKSGRQPIRLYRYTESGQSAGCAR
jgi:6-phospho-beta-glucosidase